MSRCPRPRVICHSCTITPPSAHPHGLPVGGSEPGVSYSWLRVEEGPEFNLQMVWLGAVCGNKQKLESSCLTATLRDRPLKTVARGSPSHQGDSSIGPGHELCVEGIFAKGEKSLNSWQ